MGKGVRDGVNISGLLINVYVVAIILPHSLPRTAAN